MRIVTMWIAGSLLAAHGHAMAQGAPAYPFVGRWDCEVATFTFTPTTYNNGSETMKILKIRKYSNKDFGLTFAKGYRIGLNDITKTKMLWSSAASGDSFTCRRLK